MTLMLVLACGGSLLCASSALAEQPTTGPGVLFSPFYYRNSGQVHERHRQQGEAQFGGFEGLLGPLTWTNPSPSFLAGQLGATNPQQPNVAVTRVESDAWESITSVPTFQRVQGVESLPVPAEESGSEVVPLPYEEEQLRVIREQLPSGTGLADAESVGDEPEEPRLQFLRTQTVLLEPGELQVDVGFIYSLAENDFPSVQGAQVLEGNLKQRQLFVPLEFRMGVTPRMQLFLSTPVGWSNTEHTVPGVIDDDENDGGLGDIGLGASFLLFDGRGSTTDVVFTTSVTLPTSDSPFRVASNGFNSPTLGDGFWALSGDVIWIDNYDPVVIFYGAGYRYIFEKTIDGTRIDPGGEARLQLGVGFAVNQSITLSSRFAASFVSRTQFDGVSFAGSFSEPMSMRFAATVARDCVIVEPFAEIGASDDAASSSFGVIWTY